jgi:Rab-like protein 2
MPTDDVPEEVKATKEEVAREAAGDVGAADVKIILLGDSAVGKSKLVERYLMGDYQPRQLSTFALTLYRKEVEVDDGEKKIQIDFWDTAGQERFNSMHPSYYFQAHCCILVFDVTRKGTYKHLQDWYDELRNFSESIPVICVANKIDANYSVTKKKFKFPIDNKVCVCVYVHVCVRGCGRVCLCVCFEM